MKKYFLVSFLVLGVLLVMTNYGETWDKIDKYSAEQVVVDPGGKVERMGKLYVMPDKIRMEQSQPEGKDSMVMIFRIDQKVMRILMPEKKTYIENPLSEAELEKTLKKIPSNIDVKEEDLGTETVNGFKCRKRRIETSTEFMGRQIRSRSIVWVSDQLDFPIRTQSEDGHITELQNIKPGSQPDKFFEVPTGYKKAANFFEAMSGEKDQGNLEPGQDQGQTPAFKLPKGFKFPFGGKD